MSATPPPESDADPVLTQPRAIRKPQRRASADQFELAASRPQAQQQLQVLLCERRERGELGDDGLLVEGECGTTMSFAWYSLRFSSRFWSKSEGPAGIRFSWWAPLDPSCEEADFGHLVRGHCLHMALVQVSSARLKTSLPWFRVV